MTSLETVAVVAVATLCGIDLVSLGQVMIARPLVAALLGGLVVGAPLPALGVGALLELLALETLPVGAARYPDWGPPAAAAGALVGASRASASPSGLLAVLLVTIAVAWLGAAMMSQMRRANGRAAEARRAGLQAGDPRALRAVLRGGLFRDVARSFVLGSVALTAGDLLSVWFARGWQGPQAVALLAIVGTSLGVGALSAWRLFGRGRHVWWLAGGLGCGVLIALGVVR